MAEDVTLWSSQVFTPTAPATEFADGDVVAQSADIANNNDLNSINLNLRYEAMAPDGKTVQVGYNLQAIIEQEVASGVWSPIAVQHDKVKGTDEAITQIVTLTPGLVQDPGVAEKIGNGAENRILFSISRNDGVAPDKFRVCVIYLVSDPLKAQGTSFTISGWLRKFNK